MEALKDRGTFEKEAHVAHENARLLAMQLESSRAETKSLKESNAETKQKLDEATNSILSGSNPELAKMVRLEKDVAEAATKATSLEKKLTLLQNDMDYARQQYQEASNRAVELQNENQDLTSQVIELTRKADDNIVLINQTQSRNEVRELSRMLIEQKTIVKEREAELNHVREQLSIAKNGRRETRQNSVPRSPRLASLGVMSPRGPGRGATVAAMSGAVVGAGGGALAGGSGSRATSPGPLGAAFEGVGAAGMMSGMGSLFAGQQQGNGRYSHLRD
jgi:hypothetical protein